MEINTPAGRELFEQWRKEFIVSMETDKMKSDEQLVEDFKNQHENKKEKS